MLAFELPWAFALLALPLFVTWLVPEYEDQSEAVRAPFFGRLVHLTGKLPSLGAVVVRKRSWQKLYHIVGWAFVVTALARPVWIGEAIVHETPARDLLLIVDLSGSMEEQDFIGVDGERMTRLEAVKLVIHDFIAHMWSGNLSPAKIYIEAGLPLILSHVCDGAYAQAMTSEEEMTDFTDHLGRMFDDAENMDW